MSAAQVSDWRAFLRGYQDIRQTFADPQARALFMQCAERLHQTIVDWLQREAEVTPFLERVYPSTRKADFEAAFPSQFTVYSQSLAERFAANAIRIMLDAADFATVGPPRGTWHAPTESDPSSYYHAGRLHSLALDMHCALTRSTRVPADLDSGFMLFMGDSGSSTRQGRALRDRNGAEYGWAQTTVCEVCQVATTSRCSGCDAAYFCSKACQRAAWPKHRVVCKTLRTSGSGIDKLTETASALSLAEPSDPTAAADEPEPLDLSVLAAELGERKLDQSMFTSEDFAICLGTPGELRQLQMIQPRPRYVERYLEKRWKLLKKDLRFANAVELLRQEALLPPVLSVGTGGYRVVGGSIVMVMPAGVLFQTHLGWMAPERVKR